jgi:hypothetical protein
LAPHVLLIFVAASDAGTPTSEALMRALTDALGPTSRVTLHSYPSPPSDDAVVDRARDAQATAAVRLVWDDPARTRAWIHIYVAKGEESHDQHLRFQSSDPAAERGRALGFVIASYLLPAPARPAAPVALVARPPPPEPRWALEGFGVGTVPLDGRQERNMLGAAFGVRFWAGERWGLRTSLGVRAGSMPAAEATALGVSASLGLFRVLAETRTRRLGLVGRLEGQLAYETLTHLSEDTPEGERHDHVLAGAAAALELEWRMAPAAALHLAAGAEERFGRIDVLVHRMPVGVLGRSRVVAEAGFRTRF